MRENSWPGFFAALFAYAPGEIKWSFGVKKESGASISMNLSDRDKWYYRKKMIRHKRKKKR